MSVYDFLEFKHLRSIAAIADQGTFTSAAASLPLAQSALSRQIRELEDALGIQVFERDRGRSTLALTEAGESLLSSGRKLLQMRVHLVDAIQAIHQAGIHPFRLGFTSFIDPHVLATVCDAYRGLFPKGGISPENGDTEDMLERLRNAELDAALVTLPLVPDGYVIQPVMHEPLVVCMRKDDPLAEQAEAPPAALDGRLAIFSDPRHHPQAHVRLLEMLQEQGIVPKISNPTFNAEHVQWMVRERICLALIRQGERLHEDLTTRPILGVHWTIDSALIYRNDHQQSTLPLLLHELEDRFSIAEPTPKRKAPQRASGGSAQQQLFLNGKHGTSD